MQKIMIFLLSVLANNSLLLSSYHHEKENISTALSRTDQEKYNELLSAIHNCKKFNDSMSRVYPHVENPDLCDMHLFHALKQHKNSIDCKQKQFKKSHKNKRFSKINRLLMAEAMGNIAAGLALIGFNTLINNHFYNDWSHWTPDHLYLLNRKIQIGPLLSFSIMSTLMVAGTRWITNDFNENDQLEAPHRNNWLSKTNPLKSQNLPIIFVGMGILCLGSDENKYQVSQAILDITTINAFIIGLQSIMYGGKRAKVALNYPQHLVEINEKYKKNKKTLVAAGKDRKKYIADKEFNKLMIQSTSLIDL